MGGKEQKARNVPDRVPPLVPSTLMAAERLNETNLQKQTNELNQNYENFFDVCMKFDCLCNQLVLFTQKNGNKYGNNG